MKAQSNKGENVPLCKKNSGSITVLNTVHNKVFLNVSMYSFY